MSRMINNHNLTLKLRFVNITFPNKTVISPTFPSFIQVFKDVDREPEDNSRYYYYSNNNNNNISKV